MREWFRNIVVAVKTVLEGLWVTLLTMGKTYRRKGRPIEVEVHDFPDKELGKAIPYGVYDIGNNIAGVTVGVTHDTAEFAVAAICR